MTETPWRGTAERRDLAGEFRRFAADAGGGYAPAYEHLAASAAGDAEILALAAHTPADCPAPNMLLAAARYVALAAPGSDLGTMFEGLAGGRTIDLDSLWRVFRAFCIERDASIRQLLTTRRVQTNEVGRAALFLPAITQVASLSARPLALLEIGSSAGLLLRFDRYAMEYRRGGGVVLSRSGSDPLLSCDLRGDLDPPLPAADLPIASRTGVDLAPVAPRNRDACRWLEALVWPEHPDRLERLRSALAAAALDPPVVLQGDALELLPGLLRGVPPGTVPVVLNAWVLNQFTSGQREQLQFILEAAAAASGRPVYRISMESAEARASEISLVTYGTPGRAITPLASAHSHGAWLEWRAAR